MQYLMPTHQYILIKKVGFQKLYLGSRAVGKRATEFSLSIRMSQLLTVFVLKLEQVQFTTVSKNCRMSGKQ